MNEAYAKDKSMQSVRRLKPKSVRVSSMISAPFGYKLSGDKKHPYLIDEPAASIVREIFRVEAETAKAFVPLCS